MQQPTTAHLLLLPLTLHRPPSPHLLPVMADPRHALGLLPNLPHPLSRPLHRPPPQPVLPASKSLSLILSVCNELHKLVSLVMEIDHSVSNPAFLLSSFFFSALDGFLLDLDPMSSSSAKGAAATSATTGWGGEHCYL